MTKRAILSFCLFSLFALLATGCGKAPVKAKGKVVKGGQPITVSEKGMFLMSFAPADNPSKTYAVSTNKDGTFVVNGPDNNGAPPGKYKVSVQLKDPYRSEKGEEGPDKFGGKFTIDKTTLEAEITNAATEIVVDVGK